MKEKIKFIPITSKQVVENNIINLRALVFEVTDACNLRCKYCGYSEFYEGYDKRNDSFMSFATAKVLIDHLAKIWRTNKYENIQQPLTIGFYGGEPLLNMKFIRQVVEYFSHLTDIGKRVSFNMTSNALLLDKHMDFLVQNNFRILISLDGDRDGQSYRIDANENNSFDAVIKNIKLLQGKFPDFFTKNISFNTVLHNRNEVGSVYEFIKKEFDKIPVISALTNTGIKPEKIDEFYKTYKNVRQSFDRAFNCRQMIDYVFINMPQVGLLSRRIFTNSGNVFDNYHSLRFDNSSIGIAQTGTCTPFMLKMFVTVNGKILQCEKINHTYTLGYLHSDRVELDYDMIAKAQNNFLKKIVKQCEICAHAKRCDMCLYQIDYLDTKDVVKCPYFTTSTQNEEEKENMDFLRENPHLYERIINEVTIK